MCSSDLNKEEEIDIAVRALMEIAALPNEEFYEVKDSPCGC